MGKARRPMQVSQSLPGTMVPQRWSHSIKAMARMWRAAEVISNLGLLCMVCPPFYQRKGMSRYFTLVLYAA